MSSSGHDLVHFNLAMAKHALDHPSMAGFANQLDAVNRLAERSVGFVWTAAEGEAGDAAAVFGSVRTLANISAWRSIDDLRRFVYEGQHGKALARRGDWFEPAHGPAYALWWVPTGYRPNWLEAKDRLRSLELHGPTPYAFTFNAAFTSDGISIGESGST